MVPGIHTMAADIYHADPCDRPSLSASIAHTILTKSPLHAWTDHPKLNPKFERSEESKFDVGTAAHSLWLENVKPFVVDAAYKDWRKKEAQEARDHARAQGMIPLLAHQSIEVTAMINAIRPQLDARKDDNPRLFTGGKAEQTIVWEEDGGVLCRARLDYLHDDLSANDDLKTTGRSANPFAWTRSTLWSIGADIQVAFTLRGLRKLKAAEPHFRYCLIETTPPYALSVVDLAPAALAIAGAKVEQAINIWRRCLETDTWPAYTRAVVSAEPPAWAEADFLELQAIEAEVAA